MPVTRIPSQPIIVRTATEFEHTPRIFIVRREARRVCRFGDLASLDLLQSVDALASGVKSVH